MSTKLQAVDFQAQDMGGFWEEIFFGSSPDVEVELSPNFQTCLDSVHAHVSVSDDCFEINSPDDFEPSEIFQGGAVEAQSSSDLDGSSDSVNDSRSVSFSGAVSTCINSFQHRLRGDSFWAYYLFGLDDSIGDSPYFDTFIYSCRQVETFDAWECKASISRAKRRALGASIKDVYLGVGDIYS